jgi:hypothetical protein
MGFRISTMSDPEHGPAFTITPFGAPEFVVKKLTESVLRGAQCEQELQDIIAKGGSVDTSGT